MKGHHVDAAIALPRGVLEDPSNPRSSSQSTRGLFAMARSHGYVQVHKGPGGNPDHEVIAHRHVATGTRGDRGMASVAARNPNGSHPMCAVMRLGDRRAEHGSQVDDG